MRCILFAAITLTAGCATRDADVEVAERLQRMPEWLLHRRGLPATSDVRGTVVMRAGSRIAVRLDVGSDPVTGPVWAAVYLGNTYKGELLLIEESRGHVLGWIVLAPSEPHDLLDRGREPIRPGDLVCTKVP